MHSGCRDQNKRRLEKARVSCRGLADACPQLGLSVQNRTAQPQVPPLRYAGRDDKGSGGAPCRKTFPGMRRRTADPSAAPDFLSRSVASQSSCGFPYRKPHTLPSLVPRTGNPGTLGMTKERATLPLRAAALCSATETHGSAPSALSSRAANLPEASWGRNDTAKSPWMQGPEGRPPNVSPARKGWEIDPEADPSAVGAALNRAVSSRAHPDFLLAALERAACAVFIKENRMKIAASPTSTENPGQPRDLQFHSTSMRCK